METPEYPRVLLTPMAMTSAQEASITNITCDDDAFETLGRREGMPEMPRTTLLRANTFRDTSLTKNDAVPYFSAQDLSRERPSQAYEKADLRKAKELGQQILEVTVIEWNESDLAAEVVMTLYRERSNREPISVKGFLRTLGRIANQNVQPSKPVSNTVEQHRGTNIEIARLYKPYQLVRE